LSLPMGWKASPPYFCAFTETCTDLANACPPGRAFGHPFSHANIPQPALTVPPPSFDRCAVLPYNATPPSQPLRPTDIYIDDFMLVAQHAKASDGLQCLLHGIAQIFTDTPHSPRRLIVSASKLAKGDATLSTRQRILGWDVDTTTMTIHLPQHREQRLQELLTHIQAKCFVSCRQWRKLLGELRSMVLALHSSRHLFSILQHLPLSTSARRLPLTRLTRHTLRQWATLAATMRHSPVPIATLVPHAPHYFASVDASAQGLGGFWMPTTLTQDNQPRAWRMPLPKHLTSALVSYHNPTGSLTNSELELAAAVLGNRILLHNTPRLPICPPAWPRITLLRTHGSPVVQPPRSLPQPFC
jgi:hypothetical protein